MTFGFAGVRLLGFRVPGLGLGSDREVPTFQWFVCSQPPPNSGNQRDIPDSSPHRYPTLILSHNHSHRMCICQDMGSQKPLNFTSIHTDPTFQWLYTLNFLQLPVIKEISRTQVHTGTPHVFCHTTTVIACVFVKIWAVKNR